MREKRSWKVLLGNVEMPLIAARWRHLLIWVWRGRRNGERVGLVDYRGRGAVDLEEKGELMKKEPSKMFWILSLSLSDLFLISLFFSPLFPSDLFLFLCLRFFLKI